jgi:hypothetical protein
VPREDSTGSKQKLGPISKQGDRYLRRILVVGACAVFRHARQQPEKYPWLTQLLARRPFKVVAVALANKMARIAWISLNGDDHCCNSIRQRDTPNSFSISAIIGCVKPAWRSSAKSSTMTCSHSLPPSGKMGLPLWAK